MIKLLDSKSNEKKELDKTKIISIYVCGPTVYDHPHIGNLRPLLTFDVLYRLLKAQKYDVKYVHNITDIDDKIIQKSNELKIPELELTKIYTREYLSLMDNFHVLFPELHKVSEEMPDIINFIDTLVKKKYAYIKDGDVYFDVRKVNNYGEISHNNLKDLYANVRIENNENKNYVLDFALWKKTDNGLNWISPWSNGRPGWHTECVVMINKYLGDQITIHGGGVDLKFPHHENENAQNYGINNKSLANIFQYIGHLTVNGQKMSKSLGNVILAKDLLKNYSSNIIRWYFYQKHYSSPIDLSDNLMQEISDQFNKLVNNINLFKTRFFLKENVLPNNEFLYDEQFLQYLNDDLNFANAISQIWNYVKIINQPINDANLSLLQDNYSYLLSSLNLLGIYLAEYHTNDVLTLIKDWNKKVNEKKYDESDKLRKILQDKKVL